MSMEQWWNDTDGGENDIFSEKPAPLPLCQKWFLHGLTWTCKDI